ncbi:MAG: hypothetical protein R2764_02290 [Bacteroidales bacterium]
MSGYPIIDKTSGNSFYSIWKAKQFFNDMVFDPSDPSTIYVVGPEAYRIENNGQVVVNITDSLLKSTGSHIAFAMEVDAHKNYADSIWFTLIDTSNYYTYVVMYNEFSETYTAENTFINTNWMRGGHFLQCEVSPKNANYIIVGGIKPYCYDFNTGTGDKAILGYAAGFHNDNRSANWPDNNDTIDVAFLGTDGGLTRKNNPKPHNNNSYDFEYIANDGSDGIRNIDIQGFDVSRYGEDILAIGTEHNGMVMKKGGEFMRIFAGGDEETVLINPSDPNKIYVTQTGHGALDYSNDMGVNSDTFYEYQYTYAKPYPVMFFKPNDPTTLYAGDYCKIMTFDTENLSLSNPPVIDSFAEPDTSITEYNYGLYLREYGISSDLPNLFFFATRRYFGNISYFINNPENQKGALFKAVIDENDSLIFTDLSKKIINGLKGGPITGIAVEVHPTNTIIYCSFGFTSSSTVDSLKKKVYYSKNLGETWYAMADGLPPQVPVNDIQYHKESGRLFLASDVGVYYYDRTDSIWMNITGDMPPTSYSQIRFSFLRNKILVGSHAKGVWEADLPCINRDSIITINDSAIWYNSVAMHGDLVVDSGGVLIVKNEVYMPTDTRVFVKCGGKLVVDGGKFTQSCGEHWQGIELWGTASATQNPYDQGWVQVVNGGAIEYAVCGIRTVKLEAPPPGEAVPNYSYTGGIIQTEDAVFLNNKVAVKFYDYSPTSVSYFKNTTFVTDEGYIGGRWPNQFVNIPNMNGVGLRIVIFK